MTYEKLLNNLNASCKEERLNALKKLIELEKNGEIQRAQKNGFVNNHIHTQYSFSPYSPSAALYYAMRAGLDTAGIMDHDSVGGCEEFIEAGRITGMSITCGFETRIKMHGTILEGRRINNPDQLSVAYVALHGIPHQNIKLCEEFLAPYRAQRNLRNRAMTENLNRIMSQYGLKLDFDKDIMPISMSHDGGSITERHILFALSLKIINLCGKGKAVCEFLKDKLNITISSKIEGFLSDSLNPYYEYDLLGVLKSDLVSKFYIDADKECPTLADFTAFAKKAGGICAYAYLGDVGDSVTGDKKAQRFEDNYLDELFVLLRDAGFNAVTYMPSRNTIAQLDRIIKLCAKHSLFEISGEDINTPRQSFICQALAKEEFKHLSTSTYALIGHEKAASEVLEDGMFTEKTVRKMPSLQDRIKYFAQIGMSK